MDDNGSVEFEFRVDAEGTLDHPHDGLEFFIDDVPRMQMCSYMPEWRRVGRFGLGRGRHVLQWKFSKDSSISAGQDRAFIRVRTRYIGEITLLLLTSGHVVLRKLLSGGCVRPVIFGAARVRGVSSPIGLALHNAYHAHRTRFLLVGGLT